jgi:presenilin-like A22 family membrane protease
MRLVFTLLLFFLLAQVVGLFTGYAVLRDITDNPFVSSMVVTADTQSPMNALVFIGYTLVGAAVIIFAIRVLKISLVLFRGMEFIIISTSSSLVFYALFRILLGYEASTIAAIVSGIAFAAAKVFLPSLKNPAAILATAGVGVVFGISMGIVPVLLFLVLLSVYDFISVFMTKHMVEMANYIVSKDLAFTVTARAPPTQVGGVKRIDLGTGDLIAPVMMEVSALSFSPLAALFVMAGSVIAMAVFLTMVWKKKLVLPALPPIVLGMLAGLLLWYALFGAY